MVLKRVKSAVAHPLYIRKISPVIAKSKIGIPERPGMSVPVGTTFTTVDQAFNIVTARLHNWCRRKYTIVSC